MSPIDDELRRVLAARSGEVALETDPMAGIEREAKSIRRRRTGTAVLGAALSVAVVALAVPSIRTSLVADKRPHRVAGQPTTPSPSAVPTTQVPAVWTWPSVPSLNGTTVRDIWATDQKVSSERIETRTLLSQPYSAGTVELTLLRVDGKTHAVWYLGGRAQNPAGIVADRVLEEPVLQLSLAVPSAPSGMSAVVLIPAPGANLSYENGPEIVDGDGDARVVIDPTPHVVTMHVHLGDRAFDGPVDQSLTDTISSPTTWPAQGAAGVVTQHAAAAVAALRAQYNQVEEAVVVLGAELSNGTPVVAVVGALRGADPTKIEAAYIAALYVVPAGGAPYLAGDHDLTRGVPNISFQLPQGAGVTDPMVVAVAAPEHGVAYLPAFSGADEHMAFEPYLVAPLQSADPGKQWVFSRRDTGGPTWRDLAGQGFNFPDI